MANNEFPVEERFGELVTGERLGIVPFALYKYQKALGLKIHEVWFLCWLFMHKWEEKDTFPSLNALHRYTGVSRQYIQVLAHGLEEKGYINIKQRLLENGANGSNFYDINPFLSTLEELIEEDRYSEFCKKEAHANPDIQGVQL